MEETSLRSDNPISVMKDRRDCRPTRPCLSEGQVGQLVASSVATGSGVASCLCGMDQVWGPGRCME